MTRRVTPTYALLNQITIAATTSTLTFSNIPQNFTDLVIVCNWANSSTGDAVRVQLNGDTASNYFGVWMTGTGSGSGATSSESSQTSSRAAGANVGPTNTFSNFMAAQFFDYSAVDKHKTYLIRYGAASTETQFTVSRWANTSAISSIRLFNVLGQTYSVGATFSLYGVIG